MFVHRQHGRAGIVIAKGKRARFDSAQTGSLQLKCRTESAVLLADAEVAQHAAGDTGSINQSASRKKRGHAYGFLRIGVNCQPGTRRAERILLVQPLKATLRGSSKEVSTRQTDQSALVVAKTCLANIDSHGSNRPLKTFFKSHFQSEPCS